MKHSKSFCLLLVAVLILTLFVGCDKETDNTVVSSQTTNGIFSVADAMFLNEYNESVYEIVRPKDELSTIAGYLFKQMKSKLNTSVKNIDDTNDGTEKHEILIGLTNRPESAAAKQYLIDNIGGRSDDYIIATIGKKIVILGMTDDATNEATRYFVDNFVKAEKIVGGIKYTNATQGDFAGGKINGITVSKFKFVKQHYNESYVTCLQIEDSIKQICDKTGYVVEFVDDSTVASDYEIIVGDCERDGVEKTTDKDAYSIKISGKKVYLNGGSPSARAMAVSEFAKMLTLKDISDSDSASGNYTATVTSYDASTLYAPTWVEDFDVASDSHETGLDLSKWNFGTDSAAGYNGRQSVRSQSSEHLFVNNGMLNFYAAYDDQKYYGFKIQTSKKMIFKYGVLEMSAILPDSGTTGSFWIALWGGSRNNDPNSSATFFSEINIVEMFGNSATYSANMHGWLKGGYRENYDSYWAPKGVDDHWSLDGYYSNAKKYACPDGKFNNGLHTFSFIWTKDLCGFACDGNLFFSINPNEKEEWKETFNEPIYIILSQATSFASREVCLPDDAPEWQESNNFQIDYVHVYQKDDGLHTLEYLD